MSNSRALCVLWALSFAALAAAAPIIDGSHITETTLENGLHVVVKQEPWSGSVALGICVKAAPLHEAKDQQGLSDLVRHVIFNVGHDDQPSIGEKFQDLGVVFDTYTSPDSTQIRVAVASEVLPAIFPRLAAAVFDPTFDEAVWARTRQERRRALMDTERAPTGRLWRRLWETAFRTHPYGRPVAGTSDSVDLVDAHDLATFHRTFYVPNNMCVIAVGDVEPQVVFDMVRDSMAKYPRRAVEVEPPEAEPIQTDARIRLEQAPTRGTLVSYAWPAAGIQDKLDVCTLDVIYAILGEGHTARLPQAFLSQGRIDAVPEVEFITKRDPGLFIVTCVCKPEAEFHTRETVLSEIERFSTEKISAAELSLAKDLIRLAYAFDNSTYSGQVGSLAFYAAIDSYAFAVDYPHLVDGVTVDDVYRVAGKYLTPEKSTLVIIRPRVSGGAVREASLTW